MAIAKAKEAEKFVPAPRKDPATPAASSEPPAAAAAAPAAAAAAAAFLSRANAGNPDVVEHVELTEEDLGMALEPAQGFEASREAAGKIHDVLAKLKQSKEKGGGSEVFGTCAAELQQQLLALRRAHRAMVKMTEMGRTAEASARRAADAEYAHLETRQYESACCRGAARRCRNLPTPQLNELRNFLEEMKDDDEGDEGDGTTGGLAIQLEAERLERTRLQEELEGLEQKRRQELEAFRELEKLGADLTARLCNVERSLEPVCDLLELRPRSAADDSVFAKLPAPLRLVFSKFETCAKEGGVTVSVEASSAAAVAKEGDEVVEPAEKRRRLEALPSEEVVVRVQVSADQQAAVLHFANPSQSLVTVAVEGGSGEALLEDLWPEDEGRNAALLTLLPGAELAKGGRPYGWAQVLCGLREDALSNVPALFAMDGVTANDVVTRVRAKLARGVSAPAASPEDSEGKN